MIGVKMNIDSLIIEVTRRCNARCAHCLRGKIQNKDLASEHLWTLFEKIDRVQTITFTGGEPTLAVDIIANALVAAKDNNVEVGNFYIATNALTVPDEFIRVLIDWWQYCDDNEITAVHYSNDMYHPDSADLEDNIHKLSVLRFVSEKYSPKSLAIDAKHLIAEGRGSKIGANRKLNRYTFEVTEWEDGASIQDNEVYLNCDGNIIAGCDWSYASQRKKENIISSVADFSVERVREWNSEFESSD